MPFLAIERIKQEEVKSRKEEVKVWNWETQLMMNICGMIPEERTRLESIEIVLRSDTVREQIRPIIERVRAELTRKNEALMTWEPIPLTVFGRALPREIRSAWVFVLRAGADTGAERHPNSHQRMMTFEGSGDMRTEQGGQWQSNVLVSNPEASLEQRWISIPQNVWHRPVVGAEADWTVVSFHTVPAEELIEEKQDESSQDGTKQMKYLEK
ncbi:MAG TPA: hypothetical protein VK556_05580 [Candidatus Udaeobacter sp.]|nr:hypothetical protein [Candidatus Udaeobacter sp.]